MSVYNLSTMKEQLQEIRIAMGYSLWNDQERSNGCLMAVNYLVLQLLVDRIEVE